MEILVKKRDGRTEHFDAEKTNKIIKWACEGVKDVCEDEIGLAFHTNIRNGITTQQIHAGLIQATVSLISEGKPNYQIVAANLLNYELRKEVWGGITPPNFYEHIKINTQEGRYTPEILEWYSEDEINKLGNYINHDRDFIFKYSGLAQVIEKYLIKNVISKKRYETPNIAYMIIAMVLFHTDKDLVKDAYNAFSNHEISLPTPVFAGVRTTMKSFSSCLLLDMGDSIPEITTAFEVIAKATTKRYGIGVDMSKMRPIGAPINGGENSHTGKVGFLRIIENTVKAWLQNSTRRGAATVTIPIWDFEIEEILNLKDVMRPPEQRVGDIDYSIGFSNIFYDRYRDNGNITLFNAHEVPELAASFGLPEFDELYIKAENNSRIKMKRTINARDLFDLFNRFRVETGRYYLINVDNVNTHSTFIDKIGMSNLCQEVCHPVKPLQHLHDQDGLIGICILSAINPIKVKTDEHLQRLCSLVVRMLDNLISYQDYFCPAAENFATKFRSIGVGVTNFAAWLAKQGLKYSSPEARATAHEFFEKFQYFLLKASNDLAKDRGSCEWFDKTKFSQGILPIDTYTKEIDSFIPNNLIMDWEGLRSDIKKYGLRNATLTCQMPCEASALSTDSTNGIERPRSKAIIKSNKSDDKPCITPNFWKWNYEYAFENYDNTDHLKMMAIIQKFFCMSISANLNYNYTLYPEQKIPSRLILKDMINAYKWGLKTIYYTNTDDGNKHNVADENSCSSGACSV
jgi:ribonucleoside-diphosphate reductase alpha chain